MKPIAIKTVANKSIIGKTISTLVALLALMVCCEVSVAQKTKEQSRFESYLQKKDVNRNGKIEPEEMSDNTRKYLSKMGFDPSKKVVISKIVDKAFKVEKRRDDKKKSVNLKVPGFGVADESSESVRAFGADSSSSNSGKTVSKTYSDSVLKQTEQTLGRYDRNQDGALDSSEMARARWGSPSPSISDLNKDGRLTRSELNERYAAREKSKPSSSNSNSRPSSSGREQNKESDRSRISHSRSGAGASYGTRRDDSNSRSSSSQNSSSRSASSKAKEDRNKYLKYSKSLIKTYDKNEDGKLSKGEIKKMRRPPVGADINDDGFVSESELVDSLSGVDKDKKSSGDSKSSSSSSKKTSYRSRSSSSSSRSPTSSSLSKLDSDGDNQVQMHEFADSWDDDTVAEFYEKDKNGDGVITAAEWLSQD